MPLDNILDEIEALIDSTHTVTSPLEMRHCNYCTTWLTIAGMVEDE